MLIDIRHEESIRTRGKVPHRIDAAAHDDRTKRSAAQDVGIGRLSLDDPLSSKLLRMLLGCLPLG